MPENKLPETVERIRNYLFPGDEKPYRSKRILWIIKQYLRYAMLAAIHGYPVGPHRRGRFCLAYRYWEFIPWRLRKKSIFSSKAFGYEFILVFLADKLKKYDYWFRVDNRWKKKIREIIETDNVYELISEK